MLCFGAESTSVNEDDTQDAETEVPATQLIDFSLFSGFKVDDFFILSKKFDLLLRDAFSLMCAFQFKFLTLQCYEYYVNCAAGLRYLHIFRI